MRSMGEARRVAGVVLVALLVAVALACAGPSDAASPDDGLDRVLRRTAAAPWEVRGGVEQLTVAGAEPGQALTLYGRGGRKLLTLLADDEGQAHFAYVPRRHATVDSGQDVDYEVFGDLSRGGVVAPGTYVVRADDTEPRLASGRIRVLGRDDVPGNALYDGQELTGAQLDVLGNPRRGSSLEDGYHYLEMRDGVKLSAMVRFPDSGIYGDGPYPTVIEYSGYGPSNPASEEPGVRLARAFGYATVSVNMRGTGCSGGVFDIFNPAQAADGYDVVEIVGRQPWVKHNEVGMVGLSYSGISQLYVAATRPPHLAAVTPQSVILDPWLEQWPGGIYNSGFTEQWLTERDRQSAPGGTSWVTRRIDEGDEQCASHQALRKQNPDFRAFGRSLETYPPAIVARDLRELVRDIDVPVYITGAFQDEQTGPQFGAMLDHFDTAPVLRVGLWNGRHPDGYAPTNLMRWFEFLELYVDREVPELNPLIRAAAPAILADQFKVEDVTLDPDRLAEEYGDDYEAARAAYEEEEPVHVTFESGAGNNEVGEPGGTFSADFTTWPAPEVEPTTWYLGDGGLTEEEPTGRDAADSFAFDPEAGASTLFGGTGEYPLLDPVWTGAEWTRFPEGAQLSYLTEPFEEDTVVAGPGYADLYVQADQDDAAVQATVSEVRPDGVEYLVQNGWLRLSHRAEDETRTDELEVVHPYTAEAVRPLRPGQWVEARVDIPSIGHPFRAGSRLRLTIATPGRNHATWEFENPAVGDGPTVVVGRSARRPSALVLPVLPDQEVPDGLPPCPALRGQVCRPYEPTANAAA
jgi:predicted acyl esterase